MHYTSAPAAYVEQASIFVFFKPSTPIWEAKDLAAGPRVISTSYTSRIFDLQVFRQYHYFAWEKLFSFPVSWLRTPVAAKGGGSLIRRPRVMGDKFVL